MRVDPKDGQCRTRGGTLGHQGWSNYETWCIHVWLTNDFPTYRHCRGLVLDARRDAVTCHQVRDRLWTPDEAVRFLLADLLRDFMHNESPLRHHASIFADLLNAALSVIDWYEIAEAFLEM
jgi:hypothetical protein